MLVRTAAAELPFVNLVDAAVICSVLAEREPEQYPAAAVRWIWRLCVEHPTVPLDEVIAAAVTFQHLPHDLQTGTRQLQELATRAARPSV